MAVIVNERARKILSEVITLHYNTCGPVGSTLISKRRMVPFSPATIRNVMMKLESQGYLHQPHTSAGRLPTDMGYRAYVEDIKLSGGPPAELERQSIDTAVEKAPGGPAALKSIADYVGNQTDLLTFHLPFRESGVRLKHIHFERLNANHVLVLWVAGGGHTFQAVLPIDGSELDGAFIEKAENYFNRVFIGMNLMEIRRQLTQGFRSFESEWDLLLRKSAIIADRLNQKVSGYDNIDFNSASALFDMPEFQNIDEARMVFSLLEHPAGIHQLIQTTANAPGQWLMFFIGSELESPEMSGFTVVVARMDGRRDCLGCVGVVGPKRMPYLKALQLLSYSRERLAMRDF